MTDLAPCGDYMCRCCNLWKAELDKLLSILSPYVARRLAEIAGDIDQYCQHRYIRRNNGKVDCEFCEAPL